MSGKLYIVGTPIGNLRDITIRALDTLKECDMVAAEDTRVTLKLLNHFEIKKPLISYHKYNEKDKSADILELAKEGKNIALVSDAGMPGISDPGSILIERAVAEDVPFEVIPGATAVITALVYSALDTTSFTFRGFFPRENKEREALFADIENYKDTLIFYESPYRIVQTLQYIKDRLGNRRIAICREITKLYESIFRGTVEEAYEFFNENSPKGEFVLVLEGKTLEEIDREERATWEHMTIEDHIVMEMKQGHSKKEAIKLVAKARGMAKNDVYKYSIDID